MSARRQLCDLQHPGSGKGFRKVFSSFGVTSGACSADHDDLRAFMIRFIALITHSPFSLSQLHWFQFAPVPSASRRLARCVESKNMSELTMVLREAFELQQMPFGADPSCARVLGLKDQGTQ